MFQQSLLLSGLARVNHARPRTSEQQLCVPGQWVDVWRKPRNKSQAAWRGPCVVVAVLGSGFVTVRWQSIYYDIPTHHIRPHFLNTPSAVLENSGPPVVPDTAALADQPAAAALANADSPVLFIDNVFESVYSIEASDYATLQQPAEFYTLQSMIATMPASTQLIHAMVQVGLSLIHI